VQTLVSIIYLLVLLLLQNYLPFKVDLLLIFIVLVSLRKNQPETLLYSFGGGFLLDALGGVGYLSTLTKTISGALANLLGELMTLEDYFMSLVLVLILTPAAFVINAYALNLFYGQAVSFWPAAVELGKLLLINLIFTPLLYWLFDKSFRT